LYLHELKKIRKVVLFLVPYYGGLIFIHYGESLFSGHIFIKFLLPIMIMSCFWIVPVTFDYSLSDDFKSKKIYQLHSLPVHRYTLMFSRYLAALTLSILTSVGTAVIIPPVFAQYTSVFSTVSWWLSVASRYFLSVSWWLGVVCVASAAMLSVKRFRSIIGVASVIILFYLSTKIEIFVCPLINKTSILFRTVSVNSSFPVWIILGFIFVLLGLIFFEKYAEV